MARNHRKNNIFLWLTIFTAGFFAIGLAALLFVSPVFRIKEITIDGLKTVPEEGIRNNIDGFLKNKTFAVAGFTIFHGDNILLLSKFQLTKSIQSEFPKIGEIKIKRHLKPKLSIIISERSPFAVFCNVEQCFWMSRDAVIFEQAPRFSGTAFLSIVNEISGRSFKLGETVIPLKAADFIAEIDSAFLDKVGIRAKEWRVLSQDSSELALKTEEGWEVRFSSTRPAERELSVLSKLLSEIIRGRRAELSYIDLRDASRIYYRFKTGGAEETKAPVKP